MIRQTLVLILMLGSNLCFAQVSPEYINTGSVPAAASFLDIPGDIRGSGMGDLSVATQMDANAAFSNPARIALFATNELSEVAVTYTPLSPLTKDIRLLTLAGYKWINSETFVGITVQYFSLGQVTFYDAQGNESQRLMPNDFALGGFYTHRLADRLSLSLTFKGIVSNATGGVQNQGETTHSGFALAGDVGLAGSVEAGYNEIDYGLAFSNIGSKISYTTGSSKSFLPMSLKLGGGYKINMDDENYVYAGLEISKPLLPSIEAANNDLNMGLLSAIGSSFSTNPSNFTIHAGAEGKFGGAFFLRAGYNKENKLYGRDSFATFGLGYNLAVGDNRVRMDGAFHTNSRSINNTFKIGLAFVISE
jgi:hypothetical protein